MNEIVGENSFALFDRLPEHTVLALTVTIKPQDVVVAICSTSNVVLTAIMRMPNWLPAMPGTAQMAVAKGNSLFPMQMAFFVRGEDEKDLKPRPTPSMPSCWAIAYSPIREVDDLCPLDSYLAQFADGL